jgi:bHLH factor
MGDHHQQQTGMQDFSLEALKAATQTGRPGQAAPSDSPPQSSAHKPPVGSEEWHKVRRDNHKEGRYCFSFLEIPTNTT